MVDILSNVKGIDFESAWKARVEVEIEPGLRVPVISSEDLIQAKLVAGRGQDLVDVAAIREAEIQRAQLPISELARKFAAEDKARDVGPTAGPERGDEEHER